MEKTRKKGKEKTLVMIKPDAIEIADKIFSELDKIGKRIKTVEIKNIEIEKMLQHYAEPIQRHGKELVGRIKKFFSGKTIILALYEGKNIIKKIREKMGVTDPSKASSQTIRGKYCKDSLEKSIKENRFVRNAMHASASKEEFETELKVWKKFFD